MLDRYWFGGTSRISPEAPVPIVHIQESDERPGGAANVAVNLASLNAQTRLFGVVGQDEAGDRLQKLLTELSIDCQFTRAENQPTITKTRVLSRGQQLIRLDQEEQQQQTALAESIDDGLGWANMVILSDYGKGALANIEKLIARCRAAGLPVLVDPKGTDFERYRGATLLTPNQSEFEAVAGRCADEDVLVDKARQMIEDLDLGALLVTRSEKGMMIMERDGEPAFLSTEAREVYDVTGAGDTVIATLAAALAAGSDLLSAASLANLAAGLVVRKIGVATATPAELKVALHQRGKGGRGLVTEDELKILVDDVHQRDEVVVMTNGCFDVLHAGHVAYLEEAKSLGDRLIVAVNDDDSVRRLKGESRPVNTLQDRMSVLAGLAAVDWVVPFSEDTPARLIASVLPNILVKGGDYRLDDIVGAREVLQNGGEVRTLAFHEGQSSTRIINSLADE